MIKNSLRRSNAIIERKFHVQSVRKRSTVAENRGRRREREIAYVGLRGQSLGVGRLQALPGAAGVVHGGWRMNSRAPSARRAACEGALAIRRPAMAETKRGARCVRVRCRMRQSVDRFSLVHFFRYPHEYHRDNSASLQQYSTSIMKISIVKCKP